MTSERPAHASVVVRRLRQIVHSGRSCADLEWQQMAGSARSRPHSKADVHVCAGGIRLPPAIPQGRIGTQPRRPHEQVRKGSAVHSREERRIRSKRLVTLTSSAYICTAAACGGLRTKRRNMATAKKAAKKSAAKKSGAKKAARKSGAKKAAKKSGGIGGFGSVLTK